MCCFLVVFAGNTGENVTDEPQADNNPPPMDNA
jgi:hypothetical protein